MSMAKTSFSTPKPPSAERQPTAAGAARAAAALIIFLNRREALKHHRPPAHIIAFKLLFNFMIERSEGTCQAVWAVAAAKLAALPHTRRRSCCGPFAARRAPPMEKIPTIKRISGNASRS